MITCERCQTENIDGSQYCDECGANLPGTSSSKKYTSDDGDNPAAAGGAQASAAADGAHAAEEPVKPVEQPRVERKHELAEVIPLRQSEVISTTRTSAVGRARDHGENSSPRHGSSTVPHAKLVIHRGRASGKEFTLCDDESHIGRWDADGGIFPDVDLDADDPDAKVSRRHARITRRGGQYYIEDLGSTNGTFVNRGRRLLPGDRQPLRDGDEVIVGKTFLKFQVLQN